MNVGMFYSGKNNIKIENIPFQKILETKKSILTYNTSADILNTIPLYRIFAVDIENNDLYYYSDKWNHLINNSNKIVYKNIQKDIHYVTSANKIYNVQSYIGGLESMFNISGYSKNIGVEFTSYGVFDDETTIVSLEDQDSNISNIILTNNSNGESETIFQNVDGSITQLSLDNVNIKTIRIILTNSYITIKILNYNNVQISQNIISIQNDFSKISFHLPGQGHYDKSITIPNIWTELNNDDSVRFLDGLFPLNSGKREDWS